MTPSWPISVLVLYVTGFCGGENDVVLTICWNTGVSIATFASFNWSFAVLLVVSSRPLGSV
jgi:hypothetical protein